MVIASLIVKCLSGMEDSLKEKLENIRGLSVEGIHNGDIIILLESSSVHNAVTTIENEISLCQGVLGVYPVYINVESA